MVKMRPTMEIHNRTNKIFRERARTPEKATDIFKWRVQREGWWTVPVQCYEKGQRGIF